MKNLHSIFTDNMGRCLVTGMETDVEIHHIFSGTDRPKSELFNFCVPLHASVHVNGSRLDMNTPWVDLDHWLKRKCQEYFIEVAQMGVVMIGIACSADSTMTERMKRCG